MSSVKIVKPIEQALKNKVRIITIKAAVITFFVLSLVLSWFQIQARSQTLEDKISMDSGMIENAIRLGDQFFLTQYFSSFIKAELVDFAAVIEHRTHKWIFYPSKSRLEAKIIPPSFSMGVKSFKIKRLFFLGSKENRWQLIYVLNFSYIYILVSLLISITMSILIYLSLDSTLSNTGKYLVKPIVALTSSLDKVNVDDKSISSIYRNREEHGFQEIEVLVNKFNDLFKRIMSQQNEIKRNEIFKALNVLSRQVVHDVRSPLGALKTSIVSIEENPKGSLELIKKSIIRIENILEDLNAKNQDDLSSLEELQNTNLVTFFEQLVKEKIAEYTANKLLINLYCSHDEINRSVARESLARAFSNLINNSIEAVESGKAQVEVSLSLMDSDEVELKIVDNGVGISEALLPRVLEYGFSHGKSNGTGVGLAQVSQMMEKIGGQLNLKNSPKGGLEVTLSL